MKVLRIFSLFSVLVFCALQHPIGVRANEPERWPKGRVLDLNLSETEDGLIPSKTLYPLYVPQGDLPLRVKDGRSVLLFSSSDSLEIPPSSLLDPNGEEWVLTMRVFSKTDGVLFTQSNGEDGFTLLIQDGLLQVRFQDQGKITLLRQPKESGVFCKNQWITIDLRIESHTALLFVNRVRVATIPRERPLQGKNMRLRIGCPAEPEPSSLSGFSGALERFKLLRQ